MDCTKQQQHACQFFQLVLLVVLSFLIAAQVSYFKFALWIPHQKQLVKMIDQDKRYTDQVIHPSVIKSNPQVPLQSTRHAKQDFIEIQNKVNQQVLDQDRLRVQKFYRFFRLTWTITQQYFIQWMGLIVVIVCCNSTTIITLILFFFLTILYGQAFARGQWGMKQLVYMPFIFLIYVQAWADPQYKYT